MLVYLLNGPNLNLLGQRQPELYGSTTLADVERDASALAGTLGFTLKCLQSNSEGQLVDWIQEARAEAAGIVINPGGYSHTSVAIFDALNAFEGKVVEVHVSNIHAREEFRHFSFVTLRADGVIIGCGVNGYQLALRQMAHLVQPPK
jgi:3-dehydroquinate dehydratase-2